jgi:chromosome segregation ATPase
MTEEITELRNTIKQLRDERDKLRDKLDDLGDENDELREEVRDISNISREEITELANTIKQLKFELDHYTSDNYYLHNINDELRDEVANLKRANITLLQLVKKHDSEVAKEEITEYPTLQTEVPVLEPIPRFTGIVRRTIPINVTGTNTLTGVSRTVPGSVIIRQHVK